MLLLCIAAEEVFQICIEESLAVVEDDKKMEYSVATGVSYIINSRSIFLNILQITMPLSEDWCGKCRTNLPPHKHRLDGSCCVLRADVCKFNLACWNGVGALCLHQTPDV